MKKDTRFSIRKLTVGVASIAVASFLASGTVDAANLSILNSHIDDDVYNPELPFEPFPPSISYTQPEAPWMQGSVDTEVPGDDVEDVTEPRDPNYEDPEAPFAPVEDVTEPRDPNYEDPEAPFAPVEDVTEPRDPNYEDPEAPFAPVEDVTEPRDPNYVDPEAPFAPVEDDEEETPETEEEAAFDTYEEAEAAAMEALENDPINGDFEVTQGADGKYRYVLKPATVIPEDYATEEEAEAAALEALADDEINNAYEIVQTADGRYVYLLSIKEEEKQPITLAKPKTVKNPTVLDGQVIQAVDFVTNKADFPVGTEFVFYAYERSLPLAIQDKAEEFQNVGTLQLKVAPNPESRNQKIEIRAIHPDAKEVAKSIEFTIVVKANSEAILWGIGERN
ncbi:DUF5633 domain-containing protein [Facklamia languida]